MTREKAITQLKEDYNIDYTENSKELQILTSGEDDHVFNYEAVLLFSNKIDVKTILSILNSYPNVEKYIKRTTIGKDLNSDINVINIYTVPDVIYDITETTEIVKIKEGLSQFCRSSLRRIDYSNKYNTWLITENVGLFYNWCVQVTKMVEKLKNVTIDWYNAI